MRCGHRAAAAGTGGAVLALLDRESATVGYTLLLVLVLVNNNNKIYAVNVEYDRTSTALPAAPSTESASSLLTLLMISSSQYYQQAEIDQRLVIVKVMVTIVHTCYS